MGQSSVSISNLPQNFRPNSSDTPQELSVNATAGSFATAFHSNTTHVRIGVSGGSARYAYSGTPTTSVGYKMDEGDPPLDVPKAVAEGMKFIGAAGAVKIHATGGRFET